MRLISRSWYYFRIGYGTYLAFVLGYGSTLVTLYYLAIKNIPDLLEIFPRFAPFALLATIAGAPLSVAIGWMHFKRSQLWVSEQDISVEANPYNYKLAPGYTKEAIVPLWMELLKSSKRMLKSQDILTPEDENRMNQLEEKLQLLISGRMVGTPRRR